MRNMISTLVGRQLAGLAITGGLLLGAAVLGFIALGCLAFALYFYLSPIHGSFHAAWITAAVYFGVAVILALIARQRLSGSAEAKPASLGAAPGGQADLASVMTQVVRDELPRHAVPATLVALVGGLAAGLNPTAAHNLTRDVMEALTRKHDS